MGTLKYPGQSVAQSLESVNVHPVLNQGFLVFPFLPSYSQGCALLEKGSVCWRGRPTPLPFSSDPLAGLEHSKHSMQFGKTKKPCVLK